MNKYRKKVLFRNNFIFKNQSISVTENQYLYFYEKYVKDYY